MKLHAEKQHKNHASNITAATGWGTGLVPIPDSSGAVNGLNGVVEALATPAMGVRVHDLVGLVQGIGIGSKFNDVSQFIKKADGRNHALAITVADVTNPRIDLVVVEVTWDQNDKKINDPTPDEKNLTTIVGTPAATPVAPSHDPKTQILLFHVAVGAGVTQINPADLTDKRVFIKTVPQLSADIRRVVAKCRRGFRQVQFQLDDHEERIVTLESRGGSNSISTPIELASGAGPNQISTIDANMDAGLFASDAILQLKPSAPGAGVEVFKEGFNIPVGGGVSALDHPLASVFASPFLLGTGVGMAADEVLSYFIGNLQDPGIITGKTFQADTEWKFKHKVGALATSDTGWNAGALAVENDGNFSRVFQVNIGVVRGFSNLLEVVGVYQLSNTSFTEFRTVGFSVNIPFGANDLLGSEITVKMADSGFGNPSVEIIVASGPGAGTFNVPVSFSDQSPTSPAPTSGGPLTGLQVNFDLAAAAGGGPNGGNNGNNGDNGFDIGLNGPEPAARTLEMLDLNAAGGLGVTFSTPGLVTTTNVASVDLLLTALLSGNVTLPPGTSLGLEIDRGGGFEALSAINTHQEYDGASTGSVVALRLTLATTDTSVTPTIRSLIFSSDNATRQADWVALAQKFNAAIDKLIAEANTATFVAGDKITIP